MASGNEGEFMQKYLTPIAVLLGAVIIAVALIFGSGVRGPNPNDPNAAPLANIDEVTVAGEPVAGNPDAPVTLALFFDYQCPFCKQFELAVVPELMPFVEAGQLKIVYKDFHFLGEDSITAARFGRAVNELYPDRFHEWMVAMMTAQDDEGDRGFGDLASIQELTSSLSGMDVARITALMNEKQGDYDRAIQASYQEGVSMGINGTPTVIIGEKLLSGRSPAQFLAEITAEIEAQI